MENRKNVEQNTKDKLQEICIYKEQTKLDEIKNIEIDITEKIRVIESQTKEVRRKLNDLRRKLKRKKEARKEYSRNIIKDSPKQVDKNGYMLLHEFDFQIKEMIREIKCQERILASCEQLLKELSNKEKEIKDKKTENSKEEKNNKVYYLILQCLLDDDKNYLFLKEIIGNNPNFINARYANHPILFDILDKYIENLKLSLLNQKVKHENPNYFYALLKLFRNPVLELTEEEENYFQVRIKDLKEYIKKKKYVDVENINQKLENLLENKERIIEPPIEGSAKIEQETLDTMAKTNKSAVNLTREYLEKINFLVSKFQTYYVETYGIFPNEKETSKNLNVSLQDIRNSMIVLDTIAFENQKYAISFGFSKSYGTFLRIHILDTSLLYENSPSLQMIKKSENKTLKQVKKALKFKKGNTYPVITYQLKIEKGLVSNFKVYESTIKIDQVITNEELKEDRSNSILNKLIENLHLLRNYFHLEKEIYDTESMENLIDAVININLKEYVKKLNLPILYFTELEMEEQDKILLHYQICHYLVKLPKKEATLIFNQLKQLTVNRYYSFVPIEESKIEIDTKNQIGYLNSLLIKCSIHGFVEGKKIELYKNMLEEVLNNLDQEELFVDYFNERKLIRSKKEEEVYLKRTQEKESLKRDRKIARNRTI